MAEWRVILGFPNYEVSSEGQVRSLPRRVAGRFPGTLKRRKGQLLKGGKAGQGYRSVTLCREGEQKVVYIHQLVLEAFLGPRPPGHHAAHGDGNRINNCVSNLRWATPTENHADKRVHGTLRSGSRVYLSKLNEGIVRELRSAKLEVGDQRRLAKKYGVNPSVICEAISGKTWKHVPSISNL